MGPRRGRRGNLTSGISNGTSQPRLQWGRVVEDAETTFAPATKAAVPKGFNGAASWKTRKPAGGQLVIDGVVSLQWGRVVEDAETS